MPSRPRLELAALSLSVAFVLILPALLMPLQRRFYASHFPQEFARWPHNGSFHMAESFHMAADAYPYFARMRHGGEHAWPGDPHLLENRSRRLALRDGLSFFALGWFYRLAGAMSPAIVLAQFGFSLIWVPLLFLLLLRAGLDRERALWAAAALTLFNDLLRVPVNWGLADLPELLKACAQYSFWPLGSYNYWFGPTRFTRPLATYPFLFGAALLFLRAAERRGASPAAAAGLAGAALAYVHPDVYAAFLGAGIVFGARELWLKQRERALRLGGALALALLGALPWWLTSLGIGREAESISRPEFAPATLIFLGGACLCLRRGASPGLAWIGALLLAMFGAHNLQFLLGWQSHGAPLWFFLGNLFTALALAALLLPKLKLSALSWRWLAFAAVLAAIPRALGYSIHHFKIYALAQDQEAAFAWLEGSAPKDSVVAALGPLTNLRLPVHAGSRTLVSMPFPLTSDVSRAENADRLRYAATLFGVSANALLSHCRSGDSGWEDRLWLGELDEKALETSGLCRRYFLAEHDYEEGVERPLRAAWERDLRTDFRFDYLWVGRFERELGVDPRALAKRLKARVAFESGQVAIIAR